MMNRWSRWIRALVALLVAVCAGCTSTGSPAPDRSVAAKSAAGNPDQRLALIIGNSKYADSPLINPVNDARAMSSTLSGLGFTVTSLYDASLTDMNDAARQFGDKLRAGGVGLFFYAGHGMQIRGKNYLIPVGADIKREDEVQYKAFDASQLLDKMESARNPINIVILDACRNNPFSRSFRSSATGLAQMEAPVGTYVSFSTAPGRVASDGDGSNGLFTQHLLTSLRTPGQKVEDVFKQVRVRVMQASGGQQIPWDSSSLTGDFYFIRPDGSSAQPTVAESGDAAAKPALQPAAAPAQGRQSAADVPSRVSSQPVSQQPGSATASSSQSATTSRPPAPVNPLAAPQSSAAGKSESASASSPPGTRPASKSTAQQDRVLLAKANVSPSATPPAHAGGDDAYRRGIDAVKKSDMQGAFESFSQAAEQGNAAAQYELAMMQKTGRNPVKQDVGQARRWFARAAEQGNTPAQFELGQMVDQGTGGDKNCKEAEKWLHKAADKAHLEAMVQLGWMNLRGCGGDKNPAEAAKWLRQAAAKGSRDAQFSLGVLYFNGEGVAKDPREARKLLEAAASKGHPSAKFYLDRLQ